MGQLSRKMESKYTITLNLLFPFIFLYRYVLSSVVKDVMDSKGRVKSYVINYGIRKVKKKVVKRKKPGRRAPSKKRKPKKRRGKK